SASVMDASLVSLSSSRKRWFRSAKTLRCRPGRIVGWAKALAMRCRRPKSVVRRAHESQSIKRIKHPWARRTIGVVLVQFSARAFAHPTIHCFRLNYVGSKNPRPLFAALGQGVALIPLFRLPRKSRGSARRQGAVPGLLRAGVSGLLRT